MVLRRLQHWYAEQCNGDWEHQKGIEIGTLDNPGWCVKVHLTGTPLENVTFKEIQEPAETEAYQQSNRWMHCRVVDNVWQGYGDETKLECILEAFLSWSEGAQT